MTAPRPRIPVNLVAGALGTGKTTTIRHLLAHRPAGERWAVLVNEYGLVGLDEALLEADDPTTSGDPVVVKEVAGGCICCTAGIFFDMALVTLLQKRPDRLIIEPTGLAALSGVLDTLDRDGIREHVDVRSIVCLVDPARLDHALARAESRDQLEAADVLLASRSDLATAPQVDRFNAWSGDLFPPKRHVGRVLYGRMPVDLLDLVRDRAGAAHRAGHAHSADHGHGQGHEHEHEHEHEHGHEHGDRPASSGPEPLPPIVRREHRSADASTVGWICAPHVTFEPAAIDAWLRELASRPATRRVKAVVHTVRGWRGYNLVDGFEAVRPTGYRRDSRIEVIFDGGPPDGSDALDAELRACEVT